jgi:hypothetical protein
MEIAPLHPNLPVLFWIALIVALGAGAFTVYLLTGKAPWKGRLWRQVFPLWGFIVSLLALGVAFFSFWEHLKTGPIRFEAEEIRTSYGATRYEDIVRVYFHRETERSLIDPDLGKDTTTWLIIEDRKGKTHALSEDQYDLTAIRQTLEGFLDEENRQGK